MQFLTAHKLVKSFTSGPDLEFRLAMSGEAENLDLFLRAHAATCGFMCRHQTLPFNTLQQFIRQDNVGESKNIILLFPWDLLPCLDWRTGFTEDELSLPDLLASVRKTADLLASVSNSGFIYINAPIPPVSITCDQNENLRVHLLSTAHDLGAQIFDKSAFSLSNYLAHGTPVASGHLSQVAKAVIDLATDTVKQSCKILATDLDNVMWRGVIGEDGLENIEFGPSGAGFGHFLYQSYLKRLKSQGVVLVAVSRNDSDLANLPFEKGNMLLGKEDFVSIIASYNAKSAQIAQVADELNLGLDSIVFIDDNPLEITEVTEQLPAVNCLLFPGKNENLPAFFTQLSTFFDRQKVSDEDRRRTELYRTRLKSMIPSETQGGDLTAFLADLKMKLIIRQRQTEDFERAIQLINKTNQFNLNGVRLTESDVTQVLDRGGRLFTAELEDKNGSHGEILACLIDSNARVTAYVLSCRVFQRRVEFAFLVWLAQQKIYDTLSFEYSRTDRNIPIQQFFNDNAFDVKPKSMPSMSPQKLIEGHGNSFQLFEVVAKPISQR